LNEADQAGISHAQRQRLGADLSRLRRLAGISGRDMARRIGASQAHVSRVEAGKAVPTLPQVRAWADAVEVPEDARPALVALTEAALNEFDSFQDRDGRELAAMQRDVAGLEAEAALSRHFQPAMVPGLLQTAEYARRVLAITDIHGWGDHAAAVAARIERQQVLYKPGRRFEFLLTEAAVRLRLGPPHVMQGQTARIRTVMSLANVDIGIVPLAADAKVIPWCSFHLYDDLPDGQAAFVALELPHGRLTVSDPAGVAVYTEQLEAVRQAAVHGADAERLLDVIDSS
jgi:transcriptional regulator with XRE-family HTH domain